MRRSLSLLGALVLVVVGLAGCAPRPVAGEGYRLIFRDEFNDTTIGSQWGLGNPWFSPPSDAIFEAFGVVTLESRQSQGWPSLALNTLGQRTDTSYPHYRDALTFTRGNGRYFEARIRYTNSPHSWPAFWLFGAEHAQRWPDTACPTVHGEWDMMENFMQRVNGAYRHTEFGAAAHRSTDDSCGVPQRSWVLRRDLGMDMTGWHTYGGKWANGQMCSYVDDVRIGCIGEFDTMNQPMYLLISQNARCVPAGSCPDIPKPAAISLQVDWVRVWSIP